MTRETDAGVRPAIQTPRERSVSDVAREAFESSLIEGDRPAAKRRIAAKPAPD